MSKLNIDQRTIASLFSDKRSDFLIPDYQRPYAWGEDECVTLWEDLKSFAFPNESSQDFDSENDEYFLGPIVTFKNEDGKQEIIDGQQRLTTMMLLLRAFYSRFEHAQDDDTVETRKLIARCIWKTNELGRPIFDRLKIDSEVASDDDKGEFLSILERGVADGSMRSRYAVAYRFFSEKIADFVDKMPMYTALFPIRILNNVILLPIEAESQDTALRIFSTLNDRGLPLADADIFKSQFYKHFSAEGRKDEFVARWKRLEETANLLFKPASGTPLDELFTRYMYYRRAKKGIRDTTTKSLRDFYSEGGYEIIKQDETLDDLEALLDFWRRVDAQEGFSERVLRRLFVLSYAPNGMWAYLLSTWFLARRDADGNLDDEELYGFLCYITGFIYAYSLERPGVIALRGPVYPALIDIVNGRDADFSAHLFDRETITGRFRSYQFTNQRRFTRSMLVWWAYYDPEQPLMDLDTTLEIEHIYARKRNEVHPLADRSNLEALGNKAMLEKRVNIRAADYQLADKRKYYEGYTNDKGAEVPGTAVRELVEIARRGDFAEADIEERTERIIAAFVDWLGELGLLRE